MELLTLSHVEENQEKIGQLIISINLLGSIEHLPELVENIKKQNEKQEALMDRAKKFGED